MKFESNALYLLRCQVFSYSIWFQTTPRVNTMPQVSPDYFFFFSCWLNLNLQFLAICIVDLIRFVLHL